MLQQIMLIKPGKFLIKNSSTINSSIQRLCHNQISNVSNKSSDHSFESSSSSSSAVPAEDRYDIVINGGGIVGFSMFAAIKSFPFLSKRKVLLIEQQSPPKPILETEDNLNNQRKFSNRVSSITLSSKEFFEQLKAWNIMSPYAKKVSGMYVWSNHYQNGIHFHSNDPLYNLNDPMCYILENNRMLNALHQRINEQQKDNSLQKILYKTTVVDINQEISGFDNTNPTIRLKLMDSNDPEQWTRTIETKLLIGCDGFKSIVRNKSTLPYFEMDLEQMGIVGTLQIESKDPLNQIAYQRFIDDQLVIALLPLDEQHSSLVLSVPKKDSQDWLRLTETEFVSKLNQELIKEPVIQNPLDKLASTFNLSKLYGNVQVKSPPTIRSMIPGSKAAYPLGFGTTVPFLVGTIQAKVPLLQAMINKEKRVNTAIIGDAAHRVHPLAGQGLNLGLGDACTLATSLETKLSAGYELFGRTPDSAEMLSQALFDFERQRVIKLVPMLAAIHSMQTLFKFTPSAIMPMINQLELPKSLIVQFANSR